MHSLFSLKTFSARNSCFSQPGHMAEQAGASGADCLQVLYAEVNQVSDPVTSGYHSAEPVWKVILSLALGLLSSPCAHGIKCTRRAAFKSQQDYKSQKAIQSPGPFLNTTLPIRCVP